jgi:hypothetical protein
LLCTQLAQQAHTCGTGTWLTPCLLLLLLAVVLARSINMGNAAFQSRVAAVPGSVDFLKLIGFEVCSPVYDSQAVHSAQSAAAVLVLIMHPTAGGNIASVSIAAEATTAVYFAG